MKCRINLALRWFLIYLSLTWILFIAAVTAYNDYIVTHITHMACVNYYFEFKGIYYKASVVSFLICSDGHWAYVVLMMVKWYSDRSVNADGLIGRPINRIITASTQQPLRVIKSAPTCLLPHPALSSQLVVTQPYITVATMC